MIHFWLDLILKLCLLRAMWFISKPAYLILNSAKGFAGLVRQEYHVLSVYLVWTNLRSSYFYSHENSVIRHAFLLWRLSEFMALDDCFCYLALYLRRKEFCIIAVYAGLSLCIFYHWHQMFTWCPLCPKINRTWWLLGGPCLLTCRNSSLFETRGISCVLGTYSSRLSGQWGRLHRGENIWAATWRI